MSETPYAIGRIGLVIRGAYSGAAAYNALDVVQYDDSSYVCSAACTGIPPVDHQYWMLLAEGATHIEHLSADVIDAGTITADKCVAGMITATNGLISTGAIGTAQIADGSITDAKIVELTANKIAAGTIDASLVNVINLRADNLTVGTINGQRIPVLGTEKIADGAISGAKVAQNAITADKIVAEAITAAKIAANAITANKIAANTITADKVDIASLFAATATVNALKTKTVSSIQNGTSLELNENRAVFRTPEFTVEVPGPEDGEIKLKINADTAYIPDVTSPTVAARLPMCGVRTVGDGMDYKTLAEAFADLEDKQLSGDITLKLLGDDAGGTLRGVSGGHKVIITGANLANYWDTAAKESGAHGQVSGNNAGINLTATMTGGALNVTYPLGRVDDLGVRGKEMTFRTTINVLSGNPEPIASVALCNGDYSAVIAHLAPINLSQSGTTSYFTVPEYAPYDARLALILIAGFNTVNSGSAVDFDCLSVEIGPTNSGLRTHHPMVSQLNIDSCAARVYVDRTTLPNGAKIANTAARITRSRIDSAIFTEEAKVRMSDNWGTTIYAVIAEESQVYVTGSAPSGIYAGWQVDTTTAQIGNTTPTAPTTPTATTKTLTANSTGTYSSYWWTGDQSIRQGYTPSNNRIRGGMWFDMSQIPSGATVSGMRLTLSRISGYGKGADVDVKAYATVSDARNGAPALTADRMRWARSARARPRRSTCLPHWSRG